MALKFVKKSLNALTTHAPLLRDVIKKKRNALKNVQEILATKMNDA